MLPFRSRARGLISTVIAILAIGGALTATQPAQAANAMTPCASSYADFYAGDDSVVALPGSTAPVDLTANDAAPLLNVGAIGAPLTLLLGGVSAIHWSTETPLPDPFDTYTYPTRDEAAVYGGTPYGMTVQQEHDGTVTVTTAADYKGPTTVLVRYQLIDGSGKRCSSAEGTQTRVVHGTLAVTTTGRFRASATASRTADFRLGGVHARAKETVTVQRAVIHATKRESYHGEFNVTGHGSAPVLVTRSGSARGTATGHGKATVTQTASCDAQSYVNAATYSAAEQCARTVAAAQADYAASVQATRACTRDGKAQARAKAQPLAQARAAYRAEHAKHIGKARAAATAAAKRQAKRRADIAYANADY